MTKIVFAGTPHFAVPSLQALLQASYDVVGVYTQPDRPAGRGQRMVMSPIKEFALQHQLPVYQPKTLRDPLAQQELANLQPDLMVVAAYGLLLPEAVLKIPRLACINVHASLLPKWRGAAPIQRAIVAGDCETGVTIMAMEKGLDTGSMYLKQSCPILNDDTGASLTEKLAHIGAEVLLAALPKIINGELQAEKQDDEQACYANKLLKEEAPLNFNKTAAELARQVRAFIPWPGSSLQLGNEVIKVWQAAAVQSSQAVPGKLLQVDEKGLLIQCAQDALLISVVQLPGGKAQPVSALLNSPKFQHLMAILRAE